eukprot:403347391
MSDSQIEDAQEIQKPKVDFAHQVFTLKEQLIICFYEFLGTSMLVLGYNFTSAGLAVSFNLFVGILMAQKISGAMFNPAVTIALYMTRGAVSKNSIFIVLIISSQILGGYFGIIFAHLCLGEPAFLCPYDQRTGCFSTNNVFEVTLLEFTFTFFFCFCVVAQSYQITSESSDGILKAASVSLTLFAMIQTAGSISGGCFNPAFGLTQTTYQVGYMNSLGADGSVYSKYLYVYMAAPMLGGIAASQFMRYVHLPNLHR